jgi:hypothetical protein
MEVIGIEIVPEEVKGSLGNRIGPRRLQVPIQEGQQAVPGGEPEEVRPREVVLEEDPESLGTVGVQVGPGTAEQQLGFRAQVHDRGFGRC